MSRNHRFPRPLSQTIFDICLLPWICSKQPPNRHRRGDPYCGWISPPKVELFLSLLLKVSPSLWRFEFSWEVLLCILGVLVKPLIAMHVWRGYTTKNVLDFNLMVLCHYKHSVLCPWQVHSRGVIYSDHSLQETKSTAGQQENCSQPYPQWDRVQLGAKCQLKDPGSTLPSPNSWCQGDKTSLQSIN